MLRGAKADVADGGDYFVVKTPVNRGDLLFGLPALGYTYVETLFRIAVERAELSCTPKHRAV